MSPPEIKINLDTWKSNAELLFGEIKYVKPFDPEDEKYQGEENSALGNNLLFANPINPIPEKIEKEKA